MATLKSATDAGISPHRKSCRRLILLKDLHIALGLLGGYFCPRHQCRSDRLRRWSRSTCRQWISGDCRVTPVVDEVDAVCVWWSILQRRTQFKLLR